MVNSAKFKEIIADSLIIMFMLFISFIMLYPFLYCLAYSFSDSTAVIIKNVTIFPVKFTMNNYSIVLKSRTIINSYIITILRTVIGVVYSLLVTGLASYAISKRQMKGNRAIALFLIIPMYLSGGLLPYYVLIYNLHLFNNFLVYIIPNGFWAFNMLIMRTYFETLPPSLEESAKLDGASDLRIFFRIIMPLSKPIVATVSIFVGVWQWNSWFDAMLFITKPTLQPVQSLLQNLLMEVSFADLKAKALQSGKRHVSAESIKMSTLMIATLPIVFIYPFFQKYFVKGVMIGAVKA